MVWVLSLTQTNTEGGSKIRGHVNILRAKQSAKLAIRNFPGVDLGDFGDDTDAGEASAKKPPIPALPGGNVNAEVYTELS